MISKQEAELKRKFTEEMRRSLPGAMILQFSTNGAPDREVVYLGRTTRWEFKHATPEFDSPGDQELMCMRLAAVGHCRYVLWREVRGIKETLIVHPKHVHRRESWEIAAEGRYPGHDMKWLVKWIEAEHKL